MISLEILNPDEVFNDNIFAHLENYANRIEVHWGGASSGKSHGIYQKVVIKAMKKWPVPRKVLILRKIGRSLKDSSWQHIKDILDEFQMLQYCHVNKSEMTITLPNKAVLMFRGLDDPEKIKSIKGVSDVVMEEATEFTLDDYTQLGLRLRDRAHIRKQMFLMFNPVSKKNWVYSYFFGKRSTEFKLFHSTYKDNKFLDRETIAAIEQLRERNPAYYRIYALGEFATLDKLVFPVYEKKIVTKTDVAGLPQLNGLDFGYINDPSALVTVFYNREKKTIFITGEYVKGGMLNNEIATAIEDLGLSKELIFADSQERKSIDEIRMAGISRIRAVEKWPGSLIHGIQWLLQHRIVIDERCFKVIEEFENYTWKKDRKTGEYGNEPVDTFNHTIDALRYALSQFIKGSGRKRFTSASALGV